MEGASAALAGDSQDRSRRAGAALAVLLLTCALFVCLFGHDPGDHDDDDDDDDDDAGDDDDDDIEDAHNELHEVFAKNLRASPRALASNIAPASAYLVMLMTMTALMVMMVKMTMKITQGTGWQNGTCICIASPSGVDADGDVFGDADDNGDGDVDDDVGGEDGDHTGR